MNIPFCAQDTETDNRTAGVEGGCYTVDANNHYSNVLFSAICEEFYSVWSVCLGMTERYCHTPPGHIQCPGNKKSLWFTMHNCNKFKYIFIVFCTNHPGTSFY